MASQKQAQSTSELMNDIHAALQKHKFSGTMILKAAEEDPGNPCPQGGTPTEISVQLPNGTWESKIVCV